MQKSKQPRSICVALLTPLARLGGSRSPIPYLSGRVYRLILRDGAATKMIQPTAIQASPKASKHHPVAQRCNSAGSELANSYEILGFRGSRSSQSQDRIPEARLGKSDLPHKPSNVGYGTDGTIQYLLCRRSRCRHFICSVLFQVAAFLGLLLCRSGGSPVNGCLFREGYRLLPGWTLQTNSQNYDIPIRLIDLL